MPNDEEPDDTELLLQLQHDVLQLSIDEDVQDPAAMMELENLVAHVLLKSESTILGTFDEELLPRLEKIAVLPESVIAENESTILGVCVSTRQDLAECLRRLEESIDHFRECRAPALNATLAKFRDRLVTRLNRLDRAVARLRR